MHCTIKNIHNYTLTYPYDAEYLWHVVPCVLFDDGYYLPELLEQVLPHPSVTCTDHAQERRHHLQVGVKGQLCLLYINYNDTIWGDEGYTMMARNRSNQCGIASNAIFPTL